MNDPRHETDAFLDRLGSTLADWESEAGRWRPGPHPDAEQQWMTPPPAQTPWELSGEYAAAFMGMADLGAQVRYLYDQVVRYFNEVLDFEFTPLPQRSMQGWNCPYVVIDEPYLGRQINWQSGVYFREWEAEAGPDYGITNLGRWSHDLGVPGISYLDFTPPVSDVYHVDWFTRQLHIHHDDEPQIPYDPPHFGKSAMGTPRVRLAAWTKSRPKVTTASETTWTNPAATRTRRPRKAGESPTRAKKRGTRGTRSRRRRSG